MHAERLKETRSEAGTGTVVYMRDRAPKSTSSAPEPSAPFQDRAWASFQEHDLKALIEASVYEAFVRARLRTPPEDDNPFCAIYISELVPDPVDESTLNLLQSFAKIKDLSDGIEFDDGWDD